MRRKTTAIASIALTGLSVALAVSNATTWGQGGGGESSGGGFTLVGAVGQPDAGELSGGGYTLNSGFWPGATSSFKVFLPLVLKG